MQSACWLMPIKAGMRRRALLPATQGVRRPAVSRRRLDEPPDISVCIVNWNCRDLLRRCLDSLLRQHQGVRCQIVVVDNASSDGAADLVAQEYPEVLLERNRHNHGFARAANQAARLASGRCLFFLNNDTLVPPGTLRRLYDYARKHPEAGIIGPCLRDESGRAQVSCRPRPTVAILLHRTCLLRWTGLLRSQYRRYRRLAVEQSARPRTVETLMGAAMLIGRDIFFGCGGWDEAFAFGGEDFDLSIRIGRQHPLLYLPAVAITHYGRVSTRANVHYSAPNVAIGFARFLRKSGTSGPALLLYKSLITLDLPLRFAAKAVQYLWRRVRGTPQKADKSRQTLRELWYFGIRGLVDFWRV